MKRAAAFLFLALAACTGDEMGVPPAPSLKPECGEASYYHGSLAGNLTANGDTYDPEDMTAAHKTLPFGAVVRVKRRGDWRWVDVRINDRGPFVRGRIIDLSPAAAKRIGILGEDGVAEVCLEVV